MRADVLPAVPDQPLHLLFVAMGGISSAGSRGSDPAATIKERARRGPSRQGEEYLGKIDGSRLTAETIQIDETLAAL